MNCNAISSSSFLPRNYMYVVSGTRLPVFSANDRPTRLCFFHGIFLEPLKSPSSPLRDHASSHLTPCSWQHFLEQDFPLEHHVHLISGFSVNRPVMADVEHQDIITRLITLINILVLCFFANFKPPFEVADYEESSRSDELNASDAFSSSLRSPDLSSPLRKIPGKREPDIALSRQDEESSDSSASPEKEIKFSRDRPPLAIIEATSSSTRTEDLYDKWASYARTGSPVHNFGSHLCPCCELCAERLSHRHFWIA